jgi:hypothetical protein
MIVGKREAAQKIASRREMAAKPDARIKHPLL